MTTAPGLPVPVQPRESWIDVAKGIAIILVVLFHAVMYLDAVGLAGALARFNPLLDTFRMPLFFFMSGTLAARVIRLPYRQLFRKRMLLLLYLYVVWATAQTLFLLALPPIGPGAVNAGWSNLYTIFVRPSSNLWFIYALPVFFTAAWLMRRWNPLVQVAGTAILAAAFGSGLLHTGTPWDKMGRYLVFFLAAVWLGPLVRRLVPLVRWWHAGVLAGAYLLVVLAMARLELTHVPFVLLGVSVLAVMVGISFAVLLSRLPAYDFLRSLGRKTLPIYLLHTFPMTALAAVLAGTGARVAFSGDTLLPPVLGAFSIAFALLLHARFARVPGVFTVPVGSWLAVATPTRPAAAD